MKKLLLLLICILCWQNLNAQVTQREYNALVHKVNSLEHELEFLKLSTSFDILSINISSIKNGIENSCQKLQFYMAIGISDSGFAKLASDELDAIKTTATAAKLNFYTLKDLYESMTLSFIESQRLESSYQLIKSSLSALDNSIELYEAVLKEYKARS